MKKRSFDEMIAYFNRRVSEMDIGQDYKMELLGMVTAIGYKHEQTAQQWIPCSERLPEKLQIVLITNSKGNVRCGQFRGVDYVMDGVHRWIWKGNTSELVIAWMPLPEPYGGEQDDASHPFAEDVMMGGDDA